MHRQELNEIIKSFTREANLYLYIYVCVYVGEIYFLKDLVILIKKLYKNNKIEVIKTQVSINKIL